VKFTDLFIRRPVLAVVVSLAILVLGLRSLGVLSVRQYPETQNSVITITTLYTGADPALVAGFITTPLETSIAQANGIDYLSSISTQNASTIQATLRLNYDANKALTEINAKISAVINQLPTGTQQPILTIATGDPIASMYIGFYSDALQTNQITDYLVRVVQPKLQTIEGVQTAEILGKRQFALRAWLDPVRLAAHKLTAADVTGALAANDYISAIGRTQGQMVTVNLTAETSLHSVDEFENLVVRSQGTNLVRLRDVARVTLGSEDYDTAVGFDGKTAVYIGIKVAPSANLLTVIGKVREAFPAIADQLPRGLQGNIVYDATRFVSSSISEVVSTLIEALVIVTVVIFLFLGSVRAVLIPVIAMPLSLVGTFFLMLALGYTVNLLTLLALVLAIGLVVDDAIIVVENVNRHLEEGATPLEAALKGARELVGPIIAMTVVLVAVYVPIGFMGGLTGALFTEFAFTLAGSVTVSAIVALTLSPMMSARWLQAHDADGGSRFVQWIDRRFASLRTRYERQLHGTLDYLPVTAVFSLIVLASTGFLVATTSSELAPQEDQGILISILTTAPNATLEQTQRSSRRLYESFAGWPETDHVFQIDGVNGLNSSLGGMVLKPWDERTRGTNQLLRPVQAELDRIPGPRIAVFQPPPLPGGGSGLPMQFVIGTTDSYEQLDQVARELHARAQKSGLFIFVDNDLRIDKQQVSLAIDRDKAASLGLTMRDVGNALGAMLGGGYVNYFGMSGRSYRVIAQVEQASRLNPEQLRDYHITTPAGASIPLSTLVTVHSSVVPGSLNHFQQLNSATIAGVPFPGVTLGEALSAMKSMAAEVLPPGYSIDYAGQSRQFEQESSALALTFVFALIVIFLALAAQFESFRDPLIVLISVPMSICGAMICIALVPGASLNIYTEVGLITLIGLISKHGILIVEFANAERARGIDRREAIERAAGTRLRPILMTTAATVLGVLPLVFASGAGAVGRFNMGLVIAAGIAIGTLFTLYVVPAMYLMLSTRDQAPGQGNAQAV
jgi:multidrug efflux pump